ncbi:hypothetical protein UK23_33295 [Lentzea aerocolonigenes]|uniref:DUF58 domain-containing protein n=1 Tax=Lentzea aerocolonigenes TaxID=68170 RepID=A0A0F0GLM8_LENAE|nr:DUF58 domain-containing protein [Lentzea aerocolonigenes]KJK43446.1 hypothetical protein UK23_33295 [Lentzea aerocolonigenes]
MRLTVRGTAVLVVSAALLTAGLWGRYPLFLLLGVAGLAAVVMAVVVTARGVRVSVTRDVYPDRVERGARALGKLKVRNTSLRWQRGFTALDEAGRFERVVRVHGLAPGAEKPYDYTLPTPVRGRMPVGPLKLRRMDPFGLARNSLTTGDVVTLWVHPRSFPALARTGGFPRHHHEGTSNERLRGSLDLRELREYQPGDEVRDIHWKATARTGQLMVKESIDPDQPRLTVLLDTRTSALSAAAFEESVDVAASLLRAAALAGHHSRLLTSCGTDLATAGGPLAARQLLDQLCLQQQSTDAGQLLPTVRHQGGCFAVVTSGAADLSALTGLRSRYSSLFVFLLDGQVVPVPGARVLAAVDAAAAVSQWNEVRT